jgi:hypothetical protein
MAISGGRARATCERGGGKTTIVSAMWRTDTPSVKVRIGGGQAS